MLVCQVVTSLRTGGMERMVCDLTGGLALRGVHSVLFCTDAEGELYDAARVDAKTCGHRRPGFFVIDWRLVAALFRFVRKHRVELLHAHNHAPHLYGVLISCLTGLPVVVTKHGQGYLDSRRVRFLKKMLARGTDRIVLVSEDARRVAIGNGSVPEAKALVIPNGVDTGFFTVSGEQAHRDAVVIGTVGRLSVEKNYTLLVRAFARVASTAHVTLMFVGDGPDRGSVEREIRRLDLAGRCHIMGLQSDVRIWLRRMDVFCLSSDTEGLSMSLLEAGASGLPSVVTDVGGNAEIVVDGVSGYVVPQGDENAMAMALMRLVGDAMVRRNMGQAARKIVEERFSLDAMVEGYAKVYENALR